MGYFYIPEDQRFKLPSKEKKPPNLFRTIPKNKQLQKQRQKQQLLLSSSPERALPKFLAGGVPLGL